MCVISPCRSRSKIGAGWDTSSPPSPSSSLWVPILYLACQSRYIVDCAKCLMHPYLCIAQFLGCIVIGYMSWVLATSTTVNRFLSGTLVWWTTFIHAHVYLYSFGSFCLYFRVSIDHFDGRYRFLRIRWSPWDSSCSSTDSSAGWAQSVKAFGSFVWYVRPFSIFYATYPLNFERDVSL